MNGEVLAKLKAEVAVLNEAEWRGYIAAKVEDTKEEQIAIKEAIKSTAISLNLLQIQVAKLPNHCVHEGDFIRMCNIKTDIDKRIKILEVAKIGREAVAKALWGIGGFSFFGIVVLALKFVFKVF
jgi:hypothetical protein